jgi:DNA-binding Lrp family transcriptional regulator
VIFVQTQGGQLENVENEIAAEYDVAAVYDLTGEFDTAVVAKFKSREDLNSFVKRLAALPYVKKTVTTVSLNIVKEDFRIQLP